MIINLKMVILNYDNYKEFCKNNKLKILDEEMIIKYNFINKLNEIMNLDDKEKKFEIKKLRNTIMKKIYRETNKDIIKEKIKIIMKITKKQSLKIIKNGELTIKKKCKNIIKIFI